MPPSDATVDPPHDDHRSVVTAAVLVGLVVLLLGFGSGIGAVWERDASSSSSAAGPSSTAVPRGLSSIVSPGQVPSSLDRRVVAGQRSGSAPPTTAVHHAVGSTTSTTHATTSTTDTPRGEAPPCQTTDLVAAVASPFWAHFGAAHLETSPGQQVADAADLDRYVLVHTVLVEHMLAPVVELIGAVTEALDPLVTHVDAAHLETSPGRQVAEALRVDEYVLTHSVLLEHMLAPAAATVTATGC